jgi:hypothetical protein
MNHVDIVVFRIPLLVNMICPYFSKNNMTNKDSHACYGNAFLATGMAKLPSLITLRAIIQDP